MYAYPSACTFPGHLGGLDEGGWGGWGLGNSCGASSPPLTVDMLGQMMLSCVVVLCTLGCSASLASTLYNWRSTPPTCDNLK